MMLRDRRERGGRDGERNKVIERGKKKQKEVERIKVMASVCVCVCV